MLILFAYPVHCSWLRIFFSASNLKRMCFPLFTPARVDASVIAWLLATSEQGVNSFLTCLATSSFPASTIIMAWPWRHFLALCKALLHGLKAWLCRTRFLLDELDKIDAPFLFWWAFRLTQKTQNGMLWLCTSSLLKGTMDALSMYLNLNN